jgi:hypothetical protein
VQLLSDTTALLAVGHEGDHATRLTLDPAALPPSGLGFGATLVAPADGGEAREGETVVAGGRFASPTRAPTPRASAGGRRPTWSFALDTASYGTGHRTIAVRLVERGTETARDTVRCSSADSGPSVRAATAARR